MVPTIMPMSVSKGEMRVRKQRHHQACGAVWLCRHDRRPPLIGSRKPAYLGLQQHAILRGLGGGGRTAEGERGRRQGRRVKEARVRARRGRWRGTVAVS